MSLHYKERSDLMVNLPLATAWTISTFLRTMGTNVKSWAGLFGALVAAALFAGAIFFLAKAVFSSQGKGKNIILGVAALIVAGIVGSTSLSTLTNIKNGVTTSVTNAGEGTADQ